MITLSEINQQDADTRLRAYRFESAQNQVITQTATIARLTPEVAQWRDQLARISRLEAEAVDLSNVYLGKSSLRDAVLSALGNGRGVIDQKLSRAIADLDAATVARADAQRELSQ
jgi:hypothetical protein